MSDARAALVTGGSRGIGRGVALALAGAGYDVVVNYARNAEAARAVGEQITALGVRAQLAQADVSVAADRQRLVDEAYNAFGRLDLLVNNAGISHTGAEGFTMEKYAAMSKPSVAPLDEMRAVWDVNVFGAVAVYQAMLPLLRRSSDARIVNVSSGLGSLAGAADPANPYRVTYGPVYPASKTALNAVTRSMMIELEDTNIKVNIVSPAFTATDLNNFAGTQSIEDGTREVVRVALLGPDGPTGTFTLWENVEILW
jgi:NAD(P)-dependent dehydrogenase (short-subunit alcohol dehydrogenase family)